MIIVSIGNEILYGKTVNTNAPFISDQLYKIGIEVQKVITIGDQRSEIESTLNQVFNESDLVIATGGLGPTKDDITKEVICEYFKTPLVLHQPTLEHITKMFEKRGFTLTEVNQKQAEIPENAIVLKNNNGTAPGLWMESNGKVLVILPGVPFEMKSILLNEVIPLLKKKCETNKVIIHKEIITAGIGESNLSDMIETWELSLPKHISLAYLPKPGQLLLRLTGRGVKGEETQLNQELESQLVMLKKIANKYIISFENESLVEVIGKWLSKNNKRLAVAESCTGGYLSHLITSIPGSSQFYEGGIVSYSNNVKREILNVREQNLKKHGAVSEFVVNDMAINTMGLFDVDFTIAISGIAGPDGGTSEKPVGTVWIAVASTTNIIAEKFSFGTQGGREVVIQRAANSALYMIYNMIKKNY